MHAKCTQSFKWEVYSGDHGLGSFLFPVVFYCVPVQAGQQAGEENQNKHSASFQVG